MNDVVAEMPTNRKYKEKLKQTQTLWAEQKTKLEVNIKMEKQLHLGNDMLFTGKKIGLIKNLMLSHNQHTNFLPKV